MIVIFTDKQTYIAVTVKVKYWSVLSCMDGTITFTSNLGNTEN